MQVKQSVVSGNGEQKASKNSKVESVAIPKTGAVNALGGTPKSTQLQDMSAYLKIVSRLENLNARQDNLPEPAIQGFIQGLEKQVAQMNDHEKALLLRIPEVKSLNVKNAEELIDRIEDKLVDGQASLKLFELLRQPQFVELIDPIGAFLSVFFIISSNIPFICFLSSSSKLLFPNKFVPVNLL